MKSCRLNLRTEVANTTGACPLGMLLGILSTLKTPAMLKLSASFGGVSGTTYVTPLTAYRCLLFTIGAELAKTSCLVLVILP